MDNPWSNGQFWYDEKWIIWKRWLPNDVHFWAAGVEVDRMKDKVRWNNLAGYYWSRIGTRIQEE